MWKCKTLLYGYRHLHYSCKNIAEDVGTIFDNSKFELHRPLSKGKNTKIIGLKKDNGQIMKEIVVFRGKTYSYLKHNSDADKKQKAQKMS